jgi:hypothetical protein
MIHAISSHLSIGLQARLYTISSLVKRRDEEVPVLTGRAWEWRTTIHST